MSEPAPSRWAEVARVALTPPYRNFLLAGIGDDVAVWMFRTTTGWVVWSLTESPALLGFITVAMLGPNAVLGLFGGALADQFDQRALIRLTSATSALLTFLAATLLAFDALDTAILFAILVGRGTVNALAQASSKAILTRLVPSSDLGAAVALNSVTFNTSSFVGPPLAGVVIAFAGPAVAYVAAGALTLSYVWALAAVPESGRPARSRRGGGYVGDIVEGLRYCWSRPLLRALFTLHFTFAALMRPFLDLIPGIADQIFSGGIATIAWLMSSVGVGAVAGGLWIASTHREAQLAKVALFASLVLAAAMAGLVWSPWLPLGLAAGLGVGFGGTARATSIQTMTQLATEDRLRGRTMGLYATVLNGGSVLGGLLVGLAAELVGFRLAVTAGVLVGLANWALVRPVLLREAARALVAEREEKAG